MCVHDTDNRGYCVKNGPHCAFAHGANDLRPPVYDSRYEMIDDGNGVVLPPLLMILPIAGSRGRCRSQGRRTGSVQTAWTRREAC